MQKLVILTDFQNHFGDVGYDSDGKTEIGKSKEGKKPFVKEYLQNYLDDGWEIVSIVPISCPPVGRLKESVQIRILLQMAVVLKK